MRNDRPDQEYVSRWVKKNKTGRTDSQPYIVHGLLSCQRTSDGVIKFIIAIRVQMSMVLAVTPSDYLLKVELSLITE
mgnify:CR=1